MSADYVSNIMSMHACLKKISPR